MSRTHRAWSYTDQTDAIHAALRGAVAAMSMTGMRALTTRLGLLSRTPPDMVAGQVVPKALGRLPRPKAEAFVQGMHWVYGAVGGAAFGALPARVRLAPWAGPLYGTLMWFGFEAAIGPILGAPMNRPRPVVDRLSLVVDHVLYGMVLSELRRTPRT